MRDIIEQVCSKTGISEEHARTAVETVASFLKDRVPEPVAGQIDRVLHGGEEQQSGEGMVGRAASALRDLTGQRKAG